MIISIIIPVYGIKNYVRKCIKSVISQKNIIGLELECIIIDDATPDNSISIIENLLSNYNGLIKFKIIHHEKNKGLSAARNTGIMASKGDYLYFLDGDDFLENDCMSNLVQILNQYPNVELIQAGAISCADGFNLEDRDDLPDYVDDKRWIKRAFLKRVFPVTSWNKLIRREFVINNHLFFKEGIIHEDEHWNFFACKYLSSMAICKRNIYNYVVREGSIMNSDNKKSFYSWLVILEDFIKGIDGFCRKEQIFQIFERLHPMYVFYPNDISMKSYDLLNTLSLKCTWIGKFTIWCILHFPLTINRKKIIYKFIINRLLLPLF